MGIAGWICLVLFASVYVPAPGIGWEYPCSIYVWAYRRIRETDAEKAQRLLVRSQDLLAAARRLTARSQEVEQAIDDEFARRLRLVSGE